ncbi:hypothetical protein ACFL0G_00730 [Candidatus Zixiibacteriota bacterium]
MKMTRYRHTQIGWAIIVAMPLSIVLIIILMFFYEFSWAPVIVALVLGLTTLLFGSLTVEIDQEYLTARFGPGLIRKTIPLRHIVAHQQVRSHWLSGWGVRRISGGWMFNVSGLDAVELLLQDGGKFRIGTDDAQGLTEALGQVLGR